MKSTQLLYSLCTVPIALAAPVVQDYRPARVLSGAESNQTPQVVRSQAPTTVTIEGSPTIVLAQGHNKDNQKGETAGAEDTTTHNRPIPLPPAHAAETLASAVLSSYPPLTTEQLEALSSLQSEEERLQQEATRRTMHVGSLVTPGSKPAEKWTPPAQQVSAQVSPSQPARPHEGPSCASQYACVFVGVALVLVLAILMLQVREPMSTIVRRVLGREGAIRLPDAEDQRTAGRRDVSCRDPDLEIPKTINEKGAEQSEGDDDDDDDDNDEDFEAAPWAL